MEYILPLKLSKPNLVYWFSSENLTIDLLWNLDLTCTKRNKAPVISLEEYNCVPLRSRFIFIVWNRRKLKCILSYAAHQQSPLCSRYDITRASIKMLLWPLWEFYFPAGPSLNMLQPVTSCTITMAKQEFYGEAVISELIRFCVSWVCFGEMYYQNDIRGDEARIKRARDQAIALDWHRQCLSWTFAVSNKGGCRHNSSRVEGAALEAIVHLKQNTIVLYLMGGKNTSCFCFTLPLKCFLWFLGSIYRPIFS